MVLGFWQKALTAVDGWVGVGSSCRWQGVTPGKLSGGRGPSQRRGEEPALRNTPAAYSKHRESDWVGLIGDREEMTITHVSTAGSL